MGKQTPSFPTRSPLLPHFCSPLSLVLICRRHTWDMAAGTAWDNAAAYVNTYRRHIICPRHRPPACLRSRAEFNFAGKPAVVGDENILCEHHLRRSADAKYGVTIPFFPQFLIFKVTHEAFRAILSTSAIHRRCAGDPLEQMAERCQL